MAVVSDVAGEAAKSSVPGNAATRMARPNLAGEQPVGPLIVGPTPGLRIESGHYVGPGFATPPRRPAQADVAAPTPEVTIEQAPLEELPVVVVPPPAPRPVIAAMAPLLAGLPQRFDPEADDVLVCRRVRAETHDVKTFVFAPPEPRFFRYKPGQFLTFEFVVGEETIQRCYTISSSPTRPDTISITVKRVPGGPVSNWLHDTMVPGAMVRALGPMGEFTCLDHPAPKYLFLSGGSGITPMMSMSRAFHDLSDDADIVFVHAARTPDDIIFRGELDAMARSSDGFRVVHVVEADGAERGWSGFRGRLSLPMLSLIAPDFREREVFTCGPAPFMQAVKGILAEGGLDMVRYHEESFNFEALGAEEKSQVEEAGAILADGAAPDTDTFRVEFARSNKVIECPVGTSVLSAARLAGMRLPSSCTKGLCGTCKSKIVSGEVSMKHAGGIRQREIDQGMALLCCATPLSDLVIDR